EAALDLADAQAATSPGPAREWQARLELSARQAQGAGPDAGRSRVAVEASATHALAAHWAARGALRLEHDEPLGGARGPSASRGQLKEALVAWSPDPRHTWELGRIVERAGAALGTNPTDFFLPGAVAADAAPDPESRRTQRLGSVMLRGQRLWPQGALSVMWSPRLASPHGPGQPGAEGTLQHTNGVGRLLLVASHRWRPTVQPQWLLYREEGGAPQAGLNLSQASGDAVVAYAEWAGGRQPSLAERAEGRRAGRHFSHRAVLGASWTLPIDLTLTAELQHDGSALDGPALRRLARDEPARWGGLMQAALASQQRPTSRGVFVHAVWRNALWRGLDASAFLQRDPGDGGRQAWLELRHRLKQSDLSLQWQQQRGPAWSRFGAAPDRTALQLLYVHYL
ncbi:MAG: hypothetical protein ACK4PH_25540, partial [Aquincola tertiaricarbonis]